MQDLSTRIDSIDHTKKMQQVKPNLCEIIASSPDETAK